MKPGETKSGFALPAYLLAAFGAVTLLAGCVTSKSNAGARRPGDGVREYQQLVLNLREDVSAVRKSVQAVSTASAGESRSAYKQFDESLHRLEVFSIKARARADALEKRGHAYFEEWAEEIGESGDSAAREKTQARFTELQKHFEAVLTDSKLVRQEFRRFLDESRAARLTLGAEPTPTALDQAKSSFERIAIAGQQTERALDQLANTLKATEAAVMNRPATVKPGGKS